MNKKKLKYFKKLAKIQNKLEKEIKELLSISKEVGDVTLGYIVFYYTLINYALIEYVLKNLSSTVKSNKINKEFDDIMKNFGKKNKKNKNWWKGLWKD